MKKGKRICLALSALLILAPIITAADTAREEGVRTLKSKMETALQNVDSKEPNRNAQYAAGDTTYRTLSQVNMKIDSGYFNETSQSSFAKNKVMEMLGQMAMTSAFAIGTAEQPYALQQVQGQAESLSKSDDPEFQALGKKYEQLAVAINNNNDVEAQGIAQEIQQYVQQNAPTIAAGYQPTKKENALVSGFAGVLSRALGRIGSVLSTFALQALFTAMKWGSLAASPLGLGIAIMLQETIGAVASSIGNNGNVNWEPVGQAGINQSTGLAEAGANSLENKLSASLENNSNNGTGSQSASGDTVAPAFTPEKSVNTMELMNQQAKEVNGGKGNLPTK